MNETNVGYLTSASGRPAVPPPPKRPLRGPEYARLVKRAVLVAREHGVEIREGDIPAYLDQALTAYETASGEAAKLGARLKEQSWTMQLTQQVLSSYDPTFKEAELPDVAAALLSGYEALQASMVVQERFYTALLDELRIWTRKLRRRALPVFLVGGVVLGLVAEHFGGILR